MKVKEVRDLQPGEHFIWLDDATREWMATDDAPYNLQVLRVQKVKGDRIYFEHVTGGSDFLFWKDGNKAIIIAGDGCSNINLGVRCDNCCKPFGDHYPGKSAVLEGFCCRERGSGEWFVPNEQSLREHHPEAFEVDFFADLGL